MFVYDVVLVTKAGGANAVFRLGKPSFKKEKLFVFKSKYKRLQNRCKLKMHCLLVHFMIHVKKEKKKNH